MNTRTKLTPQDEQVVVPFLMAALGLPRTNARVYARELAKSMSTQLVACATTWRQHVMATCPLGPEAAVAIHEAGPDQFEAVLAALLPQSGAPPVLLH